METKKPKIKGNQDGINGRNESYQVNGKKVPRKELVKEVEKKQHSGYHIYKREGQKYVRDNPDASKKDNVNGK